MDLEHLLNAVQLGNLCWPEATCGFVVGACVGVSYVAPQGIFAPSRRAKKKKKKEKYSRTKVQVSTVPGQCSGIKEIRRFLLYFFFLSLGCPHAWIVCFAALLSLIQRHLQRCNNVTVPFGHSRFSLFFVSLCFATSPRSALWMDSERYLAEEQ